MLCSHVLAHRTVLSFALQNQLSACRVLGSGSEYRFWLLTYIRYLVHAGNVLGQTRSQALSSGRGENLGTTSLDKIYWTLGPPLENCRMFTSPLSIYPSLPSPPFLPCLTPPPSLTASLPPPPFLPLPPSIRHLSLPPPTHHSLFPNPLTLPSLPP